MSLLKVIDIDKLCYEDIECTNGEAYEVVHSPNIDDAIVCDISDYKIEELKRIKEKFEKDLNDKKKNYSMDFITGMCYCIMMIEDELDELEE